MAPKQSWRCCQRGFSTQTGKAGHLLLDSCWVFFIFPNLNCSSKASSDCTIYNHWGWTRPDGRAQSGSYTSLTLNMTCWVSSSDEADWKYFHQNVDSDYLTITTVWTACYVDSAKETWCWLVFRLVAGLRWTHRHRNHFKNRRWLQWCCHPKRGEVSSISKLTKHWLKLDSTATQPAVSCRKCQ